MECFPVPHFFHAFMHGVNDCRNKGLCHISDAEAHQIPVRIGLLILFDSAGNLSKKIGPGQLQIGFIYTKHTNTPYSNQIPS